MISLKRQVFFFIKDTKLPRAEETREDDNENHLKSLGTIKMELRLYPRKMVRWVDNMNL
jgi:hypothetical protein